jgi:hypothetical protein
MLNRIFKTVLLGVFALVITTTFTSCKKEKDTVAVIIVKNSIGELVPGVKVKLFPEPVISPSGVLPDPSLTKINITDANGRVQFTYELEAILNVKATVTIDNDDFEGENIIRLLKGKTTTKIVEISII